MINDEGSEEFLFSLIGDKLYISACVVAVPFVVHTSFSFSLLLVDAVANYHNGNDD